MSDVTARHREWGHIFADIYRDNEDANHNDIGLRIAAKLKELEGDPPAGLEDAVRETVEGSAYVTEHPVAIDKLTKDIIAAVKSLLDELKGQLQDAKLLAKNRSEAIERYVPEINKLQADNDRLKRLVNEALDE